MKDRYIIRWGLVVFVLSLILLSNFGSGQSERVKTAKFSDLLKKGDYFEWVTETNFIDWNDDSNNYTEFETMRLEVLVDNPEMEFPSDQISYNDLFRIEYNGVVQVEEPTFYFYPFSWLLVPIMLEDDYGNQYHGREVVGELYSDPTLISEEDGMYVYLECWGLPDDYSSCTEVHYNSVTMNMNWSEYNYDDRGEDTRYLVIDELVDFKVSGPQVDDNDGPFTLKFTYLPFITVLALLPLIKKKMTY